MNMCGISYIMGGLVLLLKHNIPALLSCLTEDTRAKDAQRRGNLQHLFEKYLDSRTL